MVKFTYDNKDIENIPGLKRPGDSSPAFLTPIFFSLDVLVKYIYTPGYRCEFCSETYGSIYLPDKIEIQFGINSNRKVIIWLGDLEELSNKEKLYLKSYNIQSDHNIKSEFYDAQINAIFTDVIKEVELMEYKGQVNEWARIKFGFNFYEQPNMGVWELISYCSKFKKILFNSEEDMKSVISTWNENLIEDLNVSGLKQYLKSKSISFDQNIGGNKTLELFIKEILLEEDNIIAPLFYLYDLRIWASHKGKKDLYLSTIKKMGLKPDEELSLVYKELIGRLSNFLNTLVILLGKYRLPT